MTISPVRATRTLVPLCAFALFAACAQAGGETRLADVPPAAAAATSGATHEERIRRIEGSLLPTVRVRDRAYSPATLQERMRSVGVPAVSVAVIDSGRIVWTRAYGVADAATATPATTATLFQAASISKPVAAMAALSLVQEGTLTLDDDVNRWLKRWRVPAHEWAAESPVTLRRLLSHTAGLTITGFPGYAAGATIPAVEQVLNGNGSANTGAVLVSTRPGAQYRYSGGGTTIVQLLIEEVTGVPFARFTKERVLDPVGMTASSYDQPLPDSLAARAATAHRAGAQPVAGRYHSYPEMAAAGLWTTPTDLAKWIIAMQRTLNGDTTGVLQPWMARQMIAAQPPRHGLGPQVDGNGASFRFAHGGANEGFRCIFVGFVEHGSGAVIMTNADAGATVASELLLAIATEYGWPGYAPREIVAIPISPEALRVYVGRYGTAEQPIRVTVEVEGASLIMTTADGVRREFVAVGEHRFRPTAGGGDATFDLDAAGRVVTLNVAGQRLPRQ